MLRPILLLTAILWSMTLAGCDSSPEEAPASTAQSLVKAPQAAPVKADAETRPMCGTVGSFSQVPLNTLQIQIPELNALSESQQQQVVGFLNVVPAPCCACWKSGYIAECLLQEPKGCENLVVLKDRAIKAVQQGVPTSQLQSLLSYGDYWFSPEERGAPAIGPGEIQVEVWLDPDASNAGQVAQQIASVQHDFNAYPFVSFSQRLLHTPSDSEPNSDGVRLALEALRTEKTQYASMEPATVLKMEQSHAQRCGVRSSPTWFINGYRLRGQQSPFAIKQAILRELGDITGRLENVRAAGD